MEASWFKSERSSGLTGDLPIVVFLSFGRGNVTDGLQQSVMVKPGHPLNARHQDTRRKKIVSALQLIDFTAWLTASKGFEFVMLATGGVVAPGFTVALNSARKTDVSRAQGLDNWQAFDEQSKQILKIIPDHVVIYSKTKVLLVSGDYHCAAMASITKGGDEIAKAVVVPPAYAPMRYASATVGMLAHTEKTDGYEINLTQSPPPTEGSGFALITIEKGDWIVNFKTMPVADI